MASGAVAEMIFGCVFEGSISMHDMEIERRPYHKNCSCALHHNSKSISCLHQKNISLLKKHSWNGNCSLSISAASEFSRFSLLGDHMTLSNNSKSREKVNYGSIDLVDASSS